MTNLTVESIIGLIEVQKATLEVNQFMEMDLTIKHIPCEVLKQLANIYEPIFDSDETISKPSEVAPYFYFTKRINSRLLVSFRTPSLASTIKN